MVGVGGGQDGRKAFEFRPRLRANNLHRFGRRFTGSSLLGLQIRWVEGDQGCRWLGDYRSPLIMLGWIQSCDAPKVGLLKGDHVKNPV